MKLVVGSNGELECTSRILNSSDGSVDEIYLSVKDSIYSSGRPDVKDLDFSDLEEHIKMTKESDVNLSVAFNATCYSGKENSHEFRKEFNIFLESLCNTGAERIILAHPVLIALAKKEFPKLHVSVSSFNMVDNAIKAGYFAGMGADRIILAAETNRNLGELQLIIDSYPETEFEIMLNNGCNYYCPFEYSHGSSQSHMNEFEGKKKNQYPSECTKQLLEEPWKILVSPFIRPEDSHFYEEMGVEYFKIAGRNTKTDWIINALDAYQKRSYTGNIVDILNRTYRLSGFRNQTARIIISNKKLEGLIDLAGQDCCYQEMMDKYKKIYVEAVE